VRFSCWIVGPEGPHSERIRNTIDTHDVGDVVSTHGAVTQEQLRHLYRHATVFVLPCLQVDDGDRDGIPNVLAEAMAMGVPVVSTSISGIPELIDNGISGLLVPERDSVRLTHAIRSLLESEELRNRLGRMGRQTICRKFDSRRTTIRLRDLLVEAVQQAAPAVDAVHE
jgi:glycosyltransferase involved in cell wall biosynthesis